MSQKNGLIFVITGDGKGKTTSALGMALRALGHDHKVLMVQFMKGDPEYGEVKMASQIPGFELIQSGLPSFVRRGQPSEVDVDLARQGLMKVKDGITGGMFDLVILDEINVAVDYGLLSVDEVLAVIQDRALGVHVVLTGRYAPQQFITIADTVSYISPVKHHFDSGALSQAGVEF